ncbi:MAG: hypothetical protein EBR49_01415 [Betaproteobacteria bacterium]|nr:hypothetical protein [Betaproteobacteria bacterium]
MVDSVNFKEEKMSLPAMNEWPSWAYAQWSDWSLPSKVLIAYGSLMALALAITYCISLYDSRTLREVGVWIKPMKFMAATAVFAWTTVWLTDLTGGAVANGSAFPWIAALLIVTSLFEVAYITYQGSRGEASHYNTSDPVHALLFGLMGIAAVGLTASQAWLAWEIWKLQDSWTTPVAALGVVVGLLLTFVLATVSGFLLGGNQPPAGQGLPLLGWHLHKDIRPSHFLGVHAQQFIPLMGLFAERFLGSWAAYGFGVGATLYVVTWALLTWTGLSA